MQNRDKSPPQIKYVQSSGQEDNNYDDEKEEEVNDDYIDNEFIHLAKFLKSTLKF